MPIGRGLLVGVLRPPKWHKCNDFLLAGKAIKTIQELSLQHVSFILFTYIAVGIL